MRYNEDFFKAERYRSALGVSATDPEWMQIDALNTLSGGNAQALLAGENAKPAGELLGQYQAWAQDNDPSHLFSQEHRDLDAHADDFEWKLGEARKWDEKRKSAGRNVAAAWNAAAMETVVDEEALAAESDEDRARFERFRDAERKVARNRGDVMREASGVRDIAGAKALAERQKAVQDETAAYREDLEWARKFAQSVNDKALVRDWESDVRRRDLPVFLGAVKSELSDMAGSIIDSAVRNNMRWDDSRWSDFRDLPQDEQEKVAATIMMLQRPEKASWVGAAIRRACAMAKEVWWDSAADTVASTLAFATDRDYQDEVAARARRRQMLQTNFADMGWWGNSFAEAGGVIGYGSAFAPGGWLVKGGSLVGRAGLAARAAGNAERARALVKGAQTARRVGEAWGRWGGTTLYAIDNRNQYLQRIAMDGGDVSNPLVQFAAAAVGFASAGVESIQWERGFGVRALERAQTDAYSKIVHSVFGKMAEKYGIRDVAGLSLAKAAGIALAERAQSTLFEALEEAIQQTMEEVVVQIGTDKTVRLGEALGEGADAFVQSVGPMFFTMVFGVGSRAIAAATHPTFDTTAQDGIFTAGERVVNWMRGGTWDRNWTQDKEKAEAMRTMNVAFSHWSASENDTDALHVLQGMGFSKDDATRLDGIFRTIRREAYANSSGDNGDALLPDGVRAESSADVLAQASDPVRRGTVRQNEDGSETVESDVTIGGRTIRLVENIGRRLVGIADVDLTKSSPKLAERIVESMLTTSDSTIRAAVKAVGLDGKTAAEIVGNKDDLAAMQSIKAALQVEDIGGTNVESVETGGGEDGSEVTRVNVSITLAPDAKRGTVRHEHVHAIQEVLKAAGLTKEQAEKLARSAVRSAELDSRQNRILERESMAPKGTNEGFNEEVAPMIAEAIRSGSDGILADAAKWAWNAARSLLGLQRRRKASKTAVDYLLSAMRTGVFEDIDSLEFEERSRAREAVDDLLGEIENPAPAEPKAKAPAEPEATAAESPTKENPETPAAEPEQAAEPEPAETNDPRLVASKFRMGQTLTTDEMRTLHEASGRRLTTRIVWERGYRFDPTDGNWKRDAALERRMDDSDLPQGAYMGVDGRMHEPETGEAIRDQANPEGAEETRDQAPGPSSEGEESGSDRPVEEAEEPAPNDLSGTDDLADSAEVEQEIEWAWQNVQSRVEEMGKTQTDAIRIELEAQRMMHASPRVLAALEDGLREAQALEGIGEEAGNGGRRYAVASRVTPEEDAAYLDAVSRGDMETARQYDEVVARYTNQDGTRKPGWMKAPNGADTHLTERQWVQVRTPAFKAWFGDWENDPANASRVVDENGEPRVMWRGAPFDPLSQEPGKGVIAAERYFTPNEAYARRYEKGAGATRAYFLNVRRPFDVRDARDAARLMELRGGNDFHVGKTGALDWAEAPSAEEIEELWPGEYDGLVLDEGGDPTASGGVAYRGESVIPFAGGAQVKSATDNVGTFSGENPDIRFQVAARQTDTEQFKRWFGKSKIVDANGNPLVCAHRTPNDFEAFDIDRSTDLEGREVGLGWGAGKIYLIASERENFLPFREGQRVLKLYVRSENPIDGDEYNRRLDKKIASNPKANPESPDYDMAERDLLIAELDSEIKAEGHDGIWDRTTGELAVFDPKQVKHATENIGTFGENDPRFRYAVSSRPSPEALDAFMRERGFQAAYHGTVGKWRKARFGKKNHGVEAFYLSAERGPAEGYAALRSLDTDEEQRPSVRKFYVKGDNVLRIEEANEGFDEFAAALRKAKEDGYAAVFVKGALDDQRFRLDKKGNIVYPEGEFEDAAPADIWVVFDPESLVDESEARRMFSLAQSRPSPEFAMDGTIADAIPAHLREDARAIIAERANTPAWMADPDGTPTDLSERDWLEREAKKRKDARENPLIAVHGLTADNILKAIDEGAFVNPSMAVVKLEDGWTVPGYVGESERGTQSVFVLFDRTTVETDVGGLYDGSVWTDTVNGLNGDFSDRAIARAKKRFKKSQFKAVPYSVEETREALTGDKRKDVKERSNAAERRYNAAMDALSAIDGFDWPAYNDAYNEWESGGMAREAFADRIVLAGATKEQAEEAISANEEFAKAVEGFEGLPPRTDMVEAKPWRRIPLAEAAVVLINKKLDADTKKKIKSAGFKKVVEIDTSKQEEIRKAERKLAPRFQVASTAGAERLGIRNLADAEAMERSGATRLDIWRETGWQRGTDGEWRRSDDPPTPQKRFTVAPHGVQKQAGVRYPDAGAEIARFQVGARRRAAYADVLARKRPDLDADAVLKELDKLDDPKKEKLALHWIVRGTIRLPEDTYKVEDALEVSGKAKVDPFQYGSPMELLEAHREFKPTPHGPIDPDTVPQLTGKTDMGHGVTVYLVQDDAEGQKAMREILNAAYGKEFSTWCLLHGDGKGGLSSQAAHWWGHYSSLPKKVAFLDGKPIAFMATANSGGLNGDAWLEIENDFLGEYESYKEEHRKDFGIQNFEPWMYETHPDQLKQYERPVAEEWWDLNDKSHEAIPVTVPVDGDLLGRMHTVEIRQDGSVEKGLDVMERHSGGIDEEWDGYEYNRIEKTDFGRIESKWWIGTPRVIVSVANESDDHEHAVVLSQTETAIVKNDGGIDYWKRNDEKKDDSIQGLSRDGVVFFANGTLDGTFFEARLNRRTGGWKLKTNFEGKPANDDFRKAFDAWLARFTELTTRPADSIGPEEREQGGRYQLQSGLRLWDDAGRPAATGTSQLVGLAATMILAGREDGLAEKLAPVAQTLESEIGPDEAIAQARRLLDGEAARRAQELVAQGDAHGAARTMADAAQNADPKAALAAAMESGARTALQGQRVQAQALRAVLRNERGIDYAELVEGTGVDWTSVLHSRLVEIERTRRDTTARPTKEEREEAERALQALEMQQAEEAAAQEPDEEEMDLEDLPPDNPRRIAAEERLRELREKSRRILEEAARVVAERRAKEEARRAKEEAAQPDTEAEAGGGENAGGGDAEPSDEPTTPEPPAAPTVEEAINALLEREDLDFRDPDTTAAFLRILVRNGIRRADGAENPEGEMDEKAERRFWRNPTVVRQYALSMRNVLQDMARRLLDHGSWTYNNVMRLSQEMGHWESARAIERTTAALIGRVSVASIRDTSWQIVQETRKALKEAQSKVQFSELDPDFTRKVKGAIDRETRWIRAALLLGTEAAEKAVDKLDEQIEKRQKVYDEAGAKPDAYLDDNEVMALERRKAIIQEYGGMKDLLPGEAREKQAAIMRWLDSEMADFALRWVRRNEQIEADKKIVLAAVRHTRADGSDAVDEGPDGPVQAASRGLYRHGMATLEQRLRDFFRFATGDDAAKAQDLTLRVCHRIAEATQRYEVLKQDGMEALEIAGIRALGSAKAFRAWLRHLSQRLPESQSARLSKHGRTRLTYGQALHLYGYLCQADTYAENIEAHGRTGQRDYMEREVLTPEDIKMTQALREIFAERRGDLSAAREAITGVGFGSPSPNYLPVQIETGERSGLSVTAHAYQIMPAVFSDRRRHGLDVDETADIMAIYMGRLDASARAIAYGEVGIDMMHVFGSKEVKDALVRFHGADFAGEFIDHLTDVLGGVPSSGRIMADALNKVMSGTMEIGTYVALWGNINTMLKQSVSQSAHNLRRRVGEPGAASDLLSVFKSGWRDAFRELRESDGWRARYGNGGIMDEVRAVVRGAGTGKTLLRRIAEAGMAPIQFGDKIGGISVAVGIYMRERDAYLAAHPGCDYRDAMRWGSVEAMRQNESTQQSSQTENKPQYARRGGALRLAMMFGSAPMLQSSWENLALREWRAAADPHGDRNLAEALAENFRNADARAKFGKWLQCVAINHLCIPLLMEGMTRLFSALLGKEPPDWEEEAKSCAILVLLGQYGRYAYIGSLVDYGFRKGMGLQPMHTGPSVFSTFERIVERGIAGASDLLHGDLDAALEDLDRAAQSANAPYRHVRQAVENWTE